MYLKGKVGFKVSQFILEGIRRKRYPGPDTTRGSCKDILHPNVAAGMYDVQSGVKGLDF